MAGSVYGADALIGAPALVNCAGLALSMPRLTRHDLTADAIQLVHETDLHALPSEPPRLLKGAWILESRRPDRRGLIDSDLGGWGNTVSLGGYSLEGAIYLVGIGYPDGIAVARWTPKWTGGEVEEGIPLDSSPLIDDVDRYHSWARQAARFAVVFALLLESASTPLSVEEPPRHRESRRHTSGTHQTRSSWVVRRVHLRAPLPTRSTQAHENPAHKPLPTDRQAMDVQVRGHLKRQAHGPGGRFAGGSMCQATRPAVGLRRGRRESS
jgi:hypothetical protein